MKRGIKVYKTMAERRDDVIAEYKSMSEKPLTVGEFADKLGITRAYLYKMGLSAPALNKLVVDSL
ncbi:MAG: hypothetical protein ACRDC4_06355 [Plesiomonas sp.]